MLKFLPNLFNFRTKIDAAENQAYVDIAFWGGVVPDNADQLKGKCKLGNCSIKKKQAGYKMIGV